MKNNFFTQNIIVICGSLVLLTTIILLHLAGPVHLNVFFYRAVFQASQAPYATYVIPGALVLCLFLFTALGPLFSQRFQSRFWRILFVILICLTILAIRWPFLCLGELNVDESQDIAVANTLLHDPTYWRSVDPGSHGPLTELPLIMGRLAGFAFDYSMAKSVNLLLVIGSACLLYLACSLLFSDKSARIASIPIVAFYALTHFWDFIGFNAEGPLIFLLSLALFQLGRLSAENRTHGLLQWYLLGLVLGSVPYSKLQGVPIALVITFWGLLVLWKKHVDWRSRMRPVAVYVLGGLTSSGIVGCYLSIYGLWDDFTFRYILQNFLYTQRVSNSFYNKLLAFIHNLSFNSLTNTFLKLQFATIGLFSLVGLTVFCWKSRTARQQRSISACFQIHLIFSYLFLLACVYCICIPGHIFPHYILLLIPGFGLLLCALLFYINHNAPKYLFFLFMSCILFASFSFATEYSHFNDKLRILSPHKLFSTNRLPVSKIITQFASPDATMVVWGWYYRLHVETGIPMATRTTPMHIFGIPALKEKYLNEFIDEFKKAKPDLLVEAVGEKVEIFNDRTLYSVDSYPRIKQILKEHYDLIGATESIRIFKRID